MRDSFEGLFYLLGADCYDDHIAWVDGPAEQTAVEPHLQHFLQCSTIGGELSLRGAKLAELFVPSGQLIALKLP